MLISEKLIFTASLVCIAPAVFSATPCVGSSEGTSAAISVGSYIITGFTLRCSRNVLLSYEETEGKVAVCAASLRGTTQFGGNSDGGVVRESGSFSGITAPPADLNSATGC